MDACENFLRKLALRPPGNWGFVCRADDIMRSEGFEDLREQVQTNLEEGFPRWPLTPDTVWETVLSMAVVDNMFGNNMSHT